MVLTSITAKDIQASNFSEFASSCANKYAKEEEKEKNMTIFPKCNGELLTISYLFNDTLVHEVNKG